MIRLVSQFDNEKVRASIATPSCAGCCCCCSCCCCIVTALASSVITARNLGRMAERQYQLSPEVNARQRRIMKLKARILGFFVLPITIGILIGIPWIVTMIPWPQAVGSLIGSLVNLLPGGSVAASLIAAAIVYAAVLFMLKRRYKLSVLFIAATVGVTIAALIGEFFVWLTVIFRF